MKRLFLYSSLIIIGLIVIVPIVTLMLIKFDASKVEIRNGDNVINVFNNKTGELMKLDFEEYIIGVVAAEMPASFEKEALKAQAVAARTYAYKKMQEANEAVKNINPAADIVTNPDICQAWQSDAELKEKWGKWDYLKYKKKIKTAVMETSGEIIIYDGKLIEPVYHASCGGERTEESFNVWGFKYPYLRSVPCVNHQDRHYQVKKTIVLKNIDAALGTNLQVLPATKLLQKNNVIEVTEKTSTGRVKNINIGGKKLSGIELRAKLGLKSTWFTWEINKEAITFLTRGYGHGVGLCQYGANEMAKMGKNYQEIIKHYYQGVQLTKIK